MHIKRKVSKKVIEKEEYQIWNNFIDLLANENIKNLNDIQKDAQRAFWYESEVQNGGHGQYFDTFDDTMELNDYISVINSLRIIEANEHAKILEKAIKLYFDDNTKKLKTISDDDFDNFCKEENQLDLEYGKIKPDMNFYLEKYLNKNIDEFIEIEK